MHYTGILIEESLAKRETLKAFTVVKTEVETVTPKHKTPWISQWTMHSVEVPEQEIEAATSALSKALDPHHAWYVDLKNERMHYIIFANRVFSIDRTHPEDYAKVEQYGVRLGIPDYQLDFSPHVLEWQRSAA